MAVGKESGAAKGLFLAHELGRDVRDANGIDYCIRLRRKVHHGEPLGISITSKFQGAVQEILLFDIVPTLSGLARHSAADTLVSILQLCDDANGLQLALAQLEKMKDSGLCSACSLKPVF